MGEGNLHDVSRSGCHLLEVVFGRHDLFPRPLRPSSTLMSVWAHAVREEQFAIDVLTRERERPNGPLFCDVLVISCSFLWK